jgi:threonine dehydratase
VHDRSEANQARTALFDSYMPRIMQCRLGDLVKETPLQRLEDFSQRIGVDVRIKREDLQPVYSFKLRGAYARLRALSQAQKSRGVICASAGNHAQGVAMAARHLGIESTVVMPNITPDIKISAVRKLGSTVIIHGDDFDEACSHAFDLADQTKQSFIHPYDDPHVICGQATLGVEMLRQCDEDTQFIFVPVGGGGLAAGVALAVKYLRPDIRVIGVEADESASMQAALSAGEPVDLEELGHFAEGVAVRKTGTLTFGICRHLLDDLITVGSDEICAAIQDIYEDTRAIAEPAGALALAGVKSYFMRHPEPGARVATVLSGANVNFARLRHIAERAAVGEESEILLGVTIPERPGSFLEFCEVVGLRGITEFNYRYADETEAHIFVGIALRDTLGEKKAIISSLKEHRFPVADLSTNNMARLHIRHMVGGRANVADERVLRFEFPERPGALLKFLQGMQSDWNISLFHYRNYGSEYGRILMGIQVPDEDMERFEQFLRATGYHYHYEVENEAFQMFVGSTGHEPTMNRQERKTSPE